MTHEDKQLLLKDLSARLPYGVKIQVSYFDNGTVKFKNHTLDCHNLKLFILDGKYKTYGRICQYPDFEFKPYLLPMSSMTKEECKELGELPATIENVGETLPNVPYYIEVVRPEQIDWLNANHFDYRGLIPKGLALPAIEGMYQTRNDG